MRTLAEIQATLEVAKLEPADLLPSVQCISFSESVSSGDYCLMELDETLCKYIESGQRLIIRGDKDEHAVLCSEDKTYDLKMADTSNMLLIIPDCKTPDQLSFNTSTRCVMHHQIFGFAKSYWELKKSRPKFRKLKKCLLENPYNGPSCETERNAERSKYTMEDLMESIQASEQEIMQQLQQLRACKIEGYWRILELDYEIKLLNHVTQLVDSESWSFTKIPLQICLQELELLEPREMIEHSLNSYGKAYTSDGEVFYSLSEDEVCKSTALMLLQNAVKFNLSEFEDMWQQSVPEGMSTRLDQLKGAALVDRNSRPQVIFQLIVEDLPENTQDRFKSLFNIRDKWTEDDIAPYIQGLCGEKQTIGSLLTKCARSSMQNGVKMFSSRRPV
ncbi:sister chromatid cohesion protein DCC1 [Leucoraja erinacea]|uniref:sister chromatid cohesion protein DCC1 n=1 Tax=Leucoraja erinaceus TaxID=7782 RepID=UPI002457AC66|nr:sister chromatid cohesion protein DCC1 [Leucoraja erinacea]